MSASVTVPKLSLVSFVPGLHFMKKMDLDFRSCGGCSDAVICLGGRMYTNRRLMSSLFTNS